jgi:hypothetical protein
MDSGNCRSYWKCNLQKSVGDCCPVGQRYRKYKGCEKDSSCVDPCPGDSFHQGPCDSRLDFNDGSAFQQYVEGVGWHNMTCPSNTKYSALSCGCVYHKGYDSGKYSLYNTKYSTLSCGCVHTKYSALSCSCVYHKGYDSVSTCIPCKFSVIKVTKEKLNKVYNFAWYFSSQRKTSNICTKTVYFLRNIEIFYTRP